MGRKFRAPEVKKQAEDLCERSEAACELFRHQVAAMQPSLLGARAS
jgi:hypothetical protein